MIKLRARFLEPALHLVTLPEIHKAIAFADDLTILTKGEFIAEAENYMNLKMNKIMK